MKLSVKFQEDNFSVNANFGKESFSLNASFGEIHEVEVSPDIPLYDGNYEVTPSVVKQILKTGGRKMVDDLVVEEIPYSEVSNTANGTTVTIG